MLVIGAGPIGLSVLAMARLLLGSQTKVYVSYIILYRLDLAERLGGVPLRADAGTIKGQIGEPVDCVIDTSGNSGARQAALAVLDPRAPLVCVGHGGDISLNVSRELIQHENLVAGSEYFRFDEIAPNLERLREPATKEYLRVIITHRFPVEEIGAAFRLFWTGETGKVVVVQEG